MPGPDDFLRSFVQRKQQPDNMFAEATYDPIPVEIVRAVSANYGVRPEDVRDMSVPDSRRSVFNPNAISEAYSRFAANPRRSTENLLAEKIGRFNQLPENVRNTPEGLTQEGGRIFTDVLREAKSEGLDPTGFWRSQTTPGSRQASRELVGYALDQINSIKSRLTNIDPVKNIGSKVNQFVEGIRYPGFIANPLALRNPVVEPTGLVSEGSFVNPQAVKFLKEFKPTGTETYKTFKSPFGTEVKLSELVPGSNIFDLAFAGPFGYRQSGQVKKEMKKDLENANWAESQGDLQLANNIRDSVMNRQEMLNEPLRSPALRYTLGEALGSIPVGSVVTAAPIGAEKGARARIYSALTNDALATGKGIKINLEAMPTEEEFRQAREGGGLTRREFLELRNDIAMNRGVIRSQRTGPDTWININQKEKTFDPATLKDEMIRATYNLPNDTDVSLIRNNPLDVLERTNRIDFTKPVITTESPVYKFRKGLKGGVGIGVSDLIPSPEAVRDLYAGQPLNALQKTGQSIIEGLPLAAAIGGTVSAAPALAPVATGVGLGLTGVAAGRALNEVVRQQAGEGIVPKVRQFLGTTGRTGVSAKDYQPSKPPVTPQIVPQTTQQRAEQSRQQQRNEAQRRLDLWKERFNPARGEFGLSEIFFGR